MFPNERFFSGSKSDILKISPAWCLVFSFFLRLPATQSSQTQAVGIKYMDLPTTKDLLVFCADNKKPFDYNTASPCWDWLMTFRDDGDHFAPKRMLFTKIDLNIFYFFFCPLSFLFKRPQCLAVHQSNISTSWFLEIFLFQTFEGYFFLSMHSLNCFKGKSVSQQICIMFWFCINGSKCMHVCKP